MDTAAIRAHPTTVQTARDLTLLLGRAVGEAWSRTVSPRVLAAERHFH